MVLDFVLVLTPLRVRRRLRAPPLLPKNVGDGVSPRPFSMSETDDATLSLIAATEDLGQADALTLRSCEADMVEHE